MNDDAPRFDPLDVCDPPTIIEGATPALAWLCEVGLGQHDPVESTYEDLIADGVAAGFARAELEAAFRRVLRTGALDRAFEAVIDSAGS